MKQIDLFGKEKDDGEYTKKIETPIYEPKNKQPHILELINRQKAQRLSNKIKSSNLSDDEKKFLLFAAQRHNVFNYSKVADYYAHASKEMQELMEESALVIIDFEKAYLHGYIKLAHDIAGTYLDTYDD